MKWPSASIAGRAARAGGGGGFFMLLLVVVLTCLPGGGVSVGTKSNQMGPVTQCAMSEHTCTNGKCIPLNKYCDSKNDCGDGSDEPRFCTKCNRTYYGNIGLTYNLELHRPKEDKIPYVCLLTFTAAGGMHGDIVQVTLDSFTIGRFVSYTQDGCPDGYLQISEVARTPVGGMWCGTSWGPVMFYSETRSLVLTVKLFKLARDQSGYNFDFRIQYKVLSRDSAVVRYGGIKHEVLPPWTSIAPLRIPMYSDYSNMSSMPEQLVAEERVQNYTFQMDKFHQIAHNFSEPKYYLGDLIPGTYCSRIFTDCDKKACRLQSPNFPGVYPRNLTCYYAVRQHDVPPGKHALIIVRQPKGNLIWVQTQLPINNKGEKDKNYRTMRTWDECNNVQDYVTIYDGYTTRDSIILKFCGGGQSVPSAISSGPELLVEFTTSPFGTFGASPSTVHTLNGFQLEVEVQFVDIQSPTYAKNKRMCEFWIRGTGHGILENPKHSLAPNTTCLYHLQGTDSIHPQFEQLPRRSSSIHLPTRFKIWISVLKFDLAPKFGVADEDQLATHLQLREDCDGMLRVWDGPLRDVPVCRDLNCERDVISRPALSKYGQNYTNVIARYCFNTIPRSCDHGLINSTHARACSLYESYISSGDYVTLELRNTETTVLRPLSFKLRYEFVDFLQDGLPINDQMVNECHRKFVSSFIEKKEPGIFHSARNVFMFGRGGATNFSCTYRFEAQRDEKIRIVIRKLNTGVRKCVSKIESDVNRSYCYGDNNVKLEIFERPWHGSILFHRGCMCNSSKSSQLPVVFMSNSKEVEIHFSGINMTALDDPDSVNFEASFEFIKGPLTCREGRRKYGSSGLVNLGIEDIECRTRPWMIEPAPNKFLYLRFYGIYLRKYNTATGLAFNASKLKTYLPEECRTKARVIVTTGDGASVTACPLESYSSGNVIEVFSAGWKLKNYYEAPMPSKVLSVEFLNPDNQAYTFTWFEMQPQSPLGLTEECPYRCPELDACVNASVWCDGIDHCPSGYDESFTHCSALLRLPAEILATLCVIIFVFCCGLFGFLYRKIRRHFRGTSVLQTRLKSLSSMDTAVFDEKDVIC